MLGQKRFRYAGKPLGCRAGESRYADDAAFQMLEFGQTRFQLSFAVADVLHPGQQVLALRREARAAVLPYQQGDAQISFERVHKVAYAGLGVPKVVRRLLEAARFGYFEKRLVFLIAHTVRLSRRYRDSRVYCANEQGV